MQAPQKLRLKVIFALYRQFNFVVRWFYFKALAAVNSPINTGWCSR